MNKKQHLNTHTQRTSERLYLLVLHLLHFISDLGNQEVERTSLLDGLHQSVQPPRVLSQVVQQHARPFTLRAPAADLLCVVPRKDLARAQVVKMAVDPDLVTEVRSQPR